MFSSRLSGFACAVLKPFLSLRPLVVKRIRTNVLLRGFRTTFLFLGKERSRSRKSFTGKPHRPIDRLHKLISTVSLVLEKIRDSRPHTLKRRHCRISSLDACLLGQLKLRVNTNSTTSPGQTTNPTSRLSHRRRGARNNRGTGD